MTHGSNCFRQKLPSFPRCEKPWHGWLDQVSQVHHAPHRNVNNEFGQLPNGLMGCQHAVGSAWRCIEIIPSIKTLTNNMRSRAIQPGVTKIGVAMLCRYLGVLYQLLAGWFRGQGHPPKETKWSTRKSCLQTPMAIRQYQNPNLESGWRTLAYSCKAKPESEGNPCQRQSINFE